MIVISLNLLNSSPPRADMLKPTTIASSHIHRGRVIDVSSERLRYANGRVHEIDFVRPPGAAAAVGVDEAGRVCLARELEVGAPTPDADEELELAWMPIGEAIGRILRGEWNDGKTALALVRAQ